MTAIANMTSYYATRRLTGERIPLTESINRLKANGFTHIDLNLCGMAREGGIFTGDDWRETAIAAREEADRIGVRFVQSHTPFYPGRVVDPAKPEYNAFMAEMTMRSAEINHICGVPVTVLHPMHTYGCSRENTEAHLEGNRQYYGPLMDKLGKYGICAAFENMISPTNFGATTTDLIAITDYFADRDVGVCWDTGHGQLRHPDQCWAIAQMKGRIRGVHIHDNWGKTDDHLLPFLGMIEWERVMPALREAGYQGDLVLEVKHASMDDSLKDASTAWTAKVTTRLLELFHGDI